MIKTIHLFLPSVDAILNDMTLEQEIVVPVCINQSSVATSTTAYRGLTMPRANALIWMPPVHLTVVFCRYLIIGCPTSI